MRIVGHFYRPICAGASAVTGVLEAEEGHLPVTRLSWLASSKAASMLAEPPQPNPAQANSSFPAGARLGSLSS